MVYKGLRRRKNNGRGGGSRKTLRTQTLAKRLRVQKSKIAGELKK